MVADTQALAHRSVCSVSLTTIIARGEKPTAYSTYDLEQVVLPKDS